MKPKSDTMMTALDVGTSKVACLIAEQNGDAGLKYRGLGFAPLKDALSGGNIRDLDSVEKAIRMAVSKAEKLAGAQVSDVYVSIHGGEPLSEIVEAEIDVQGRPISDADILEVTSAARLKVEAAQGRTVLHALPTLFSFDGEYHPKPPLDLYGDTLGAHLHVISVREGPLKNLEMAVRRAQLNVAGVFHAGLASARATVSDAERKVGAALVDMGAAHMGVALYYLGGVMHTFQLSDGVEETTEKIMAAFETDRAGAEILKLRHGAAMSELGNDSRMIDISLTGGGEASAPLSVLTDLMEADYRARLKALGTALDSAGFAGEAGKHVILTGGGAEARRLVDVAEQVLGRTVRIAEPAPLAGMPENAQGASLSCLIGLALMATDEPSLKPQTQTTKPQGPLAQLVGWLKDTF